MNIIKKSQSKATVSLLALFVCGNIHAQTYRDLNGNGLIDINFIEQLDSMRYNLTGTCSPSTCNGYELRRNLNFNTAASYRSGTVNTTYTTGSGWNPINGFEGTFHGNDSTISNLFIDRPGTDQVGFFGAMSSSQTSAIRNLGLLNVNIRGQDYTGSLVGAHVGNITRCFTTGTVNGNDNTGGLVGFNGGVDWSSFFPSSITQSYTNVSVTGSNRVGGFVGVNEYGSSITQRCYATGNVIGIFFVGGFVGVTANNAVISECYASGTVTGRDDLGGFAGHFTQAIDGGSVNNIFWNDARSIGIGNTSNFSGVALPASAFQSNGFDNYPQNITFTLSPSLKTYGDTLFTITPAIVSSGLAVQYSTTNTNIASINGTSVSINGAGMVSIIAYQTGNANYSAATSVSRILTVNQASQSINFGILPLKTFGDGAFTLTA
ncbi:MAG: GLUG motif-containing protein, partial [Chitinophagaceae bacterium]|nr:GLUG motif-containing protein [Chitinophagaceae bacterium]